MAKFRSNQLMELGNLAKKETSVKHKTVRNYCSRRELPSRVA